MFAASRLCRVPLTAFVTTLSKPTSLKQQQTLWVKVQPYAQQPRGARLGAAPKRKSLKERAYSPTSGQPFSMGKAALAGASAAALAGLCVYGLATPSGTTSTLEQSVVWPQFVRTRIRDTYTYFAGSIGVAAASAVAVSRSPAMMNMMMRNSWMAIIGTIAAMIGSGMVCRSIPYEKGFGAKQVAWLVHSGIIGAVIAPFTLMGGPILVRAAWYTAGVVGGLSALAVSAPSDQFLYMGGPLAMGLGVVIVSSLGGMFFPAGSALGASLYSISVYGGLILFGGFLLYDTQRIVRSAETYPVVADRKFDPINASISIFMDTVNIFIRIAMLLANNKSRRK